MWNLYEKEKELKPLVFSNGKSQADIVKEVVDAVEQGHKVIFIKGACGTGKSAIALNLARRFGKASIVVPIKSLQEQYIKDYSGKKYVLHNGNKLTIQPILGRKNFKCKYLEENPEDNTRRPVEKDLKLTNMFNNTSREQLISQRSKNITCDNPHIPCKIEIREKNLQKLKEYIKKNPDVRLSNIDSVEDIKRMTIAPVCPYWSPVIAEEFENKKFKDAIKKQYTGINKRKYSFYQRKQGCQYYEQYNSYIDSDVIIFNSLKYKIESLMGRKPLTDIEIIDECDEFLDSFAEQAQINLSRLLFSLTLIYPSSPEVKHTIDKLIDITNAIKNSEKYKESDEIYELNNTLVMELLETVTENQELLDLIELDEHNYLYHLDEVARTFYDFMDETFFSIEKRENDRIINLVTINLEKQLKALVSNNKIVVMMSGTVHSENVLRKIFGLDAFKVIEAEVERQGELIKCKHGYELECSYANFQANRVTREQYLKALSKCVSCSKKPTLVHVNSFSDLPNETEKLRFNLENLPTQMQLIEEQNNDPFAQRIMDFKNKCFDVLFTTKCSRGIDFPGEVCNSIIITRFPYPNISSIFWKILRKNNPQNFMSFYMDKARRELLQKVYRGLRSREDKVYLLSPDIRVLEFNFK